MVDEPYLEVEVEEGKEALCEFREYVPLLVVSFVHEIVGVFFEGPVLVALLGHKDAGDNCTDNCPVN